METGLSINKHLYDVLQNNENIKRLVNKEIYPLVAEESAKFPFIIFKKDSLNPVYSKDGRIEDEVDFSIDIVAENYFQTVTIAEEVRKAFELKRDTYFKRLVLEAVNEDFIENSYLQELRFKAIV